MTEKAKLKRKIKQLERCLRKVASMARVEAREMAGMGVDDDSPQMYIIRDILRRINRTIRTP